MELLRTHSFYQGGHNVSDALELMERYHISGVPIIEEDGTLVGIITNRDIRFETDTTQLIDDVMTKKI